MKPLSYLLILMLIACTPSRNYYKSNNNKHSLKHRLKQQNQCSKSR